jgi:hypothetical protein
MMSATSVNSSSPNPRVASAEVPMRTPDGVIGAGEVEHGVTVH